MNERCVALNQHTYCAIVLRAMVRTALEFVHGYWT